jgi:hypothetical protein
MTRWRPSDATQAGEQYPVRRRPKRLAVAGLALLMAASALAEDDRVDFKIITPTGFVAFTAGAKWPVLAMQTHLPVAVAVFQVPNRADEATPESTNASVSILDLSTPEGRRAAGKVGKQCGAAVPTRDTSNEWTTFVQDGCPGATPTRYSVWDAQRTVGSLTVAVRLAWPHLPNNPKGYDQDMGRLFHEVLASVYAGDGRYKPKPGEVVRRPQ